MQLVNRSRDARGEAEDEEAVVTRCVCVGGLPVRRRRVEGGEEERAEEPDGCGRTEEVMTAFLHLDLHLGLLLQLLTCWQTPGMVRASESLFTPLHAFFFSSSASGWHQSEVQMQTSG